MNVFQHTMSARGRYGLRIATEKAIPGTELIAEGLNDQNEVQNLISCTWEISRLGAAVELLFREGVTPAHVLKRAPHYLHDALQTILDIDRVQRKRHHLPLTEMTEADATHFLALGQEKSLQGILMNSVVESCNFQDGTINIDLFTSNMVTALDKIKTDPYQA
jgi:hypothetical protein